MKTVCIAKAEEVTCTPLWYVAKMVHEALKRMEDSEYWRSSIDYLESQPDVMAPFREGKAITCPNLLMNSFGRLPLYEADFGWGKPLFVGYVALKGESYTYLLPNPNRDGSFLLDITLFTAHMSNLKNYLYDL
ncbi:shikimate O-hydroxycinnamoyltransferase-like [Chenopodium quinoa]|uniref:shikimate O-hydroxycinnamoyltransferase-like n=1 Tax=Chenopodium quinoa TaxID=63459 RepID=UPI000B7922FA|nr:shikimate O-hydroxycinnamoyltransferase-like [Chenopodium quinoa]